jgi:hypothetical protein
MPSFFQELVGSKPKVPTLPTVDLGEQQRKAIAENIAAAPEAAKLARFSEDQIRQMMEREFPGFGAIGEQIGKNILSETKGELPTDVADAVKRSGAGAAVTGGFAGSGMARNLVARDLGLTSLDLTQRGLSSAESWIRQTEQLYSPTEAIFSGMFVTPQQQYGAAVEERNMQFQRNWLENQIAAMPAPWAEDLKQFVYRAMSAYSGTAVQANPYSTPGSFGGGLGGSSAGMGGGAGGGGINWGGADWAQPKEGYDFNAPQANPEMPQEAWA